VPDLLAAADLVVSAARWEGQPVGLQEALAAGVPVVATDVGGTGTVLGGAGLLVPAGEPASVPEALAEAVARVLADPGLRARLAGASTRRAAELPTLDQAVDAALGAYARAVDAWGTG
jgi:glycosyltransferase involved in cell wall biosynthesis